MVKWVVGIVDKLTTRTTRPSGVEMIEKYSAINTTRLIHDFNKLLDTGLIIILQKRRVDKQF